MRPTSLVKLHCSNAKIGRGKFQIFGDMLWSGGILLPLFALLTILPLL